VKNGDLPASGAYLGVVSDVDEIALLPARLRDESLSDREIVLPYPDVLEAIDLLARHEIGFYGWEGWARYPHGQGHFSEYPGITLEPQTDEAWSAFVARSGDACRTTITDAWHRWNSQPKDERVLYFCLTGTDEAWHRQSD
jgi:hypothetical protein